MRIISWNVGFKNIHIKRLLTYAFRMNPDILCLQELPETACALIQNHSGYHATYTYDFRNRNGTKSVYIATFTKKKPITSITVKYWNHTSNSLLNTVIYQKLLQNEEYHDAIQITVSPSKNTRIQIVNSRISCAVGTRERIAQFESLVNLTKQSIQTIYCGDLNIVDNPLFNRLTGWTRGFQKNDYQIHEREAFEYMLKQQNLINIFRGCSTTILKPLKLQLDHILIPPTMSVIHKEVSKRTFGSDHRMLLADVSVPSAV